MTQVSTMDALKGVVDILQPLSSEERARIFHAALVMLGDAVPSHKTDDPNESALQIPPRANTWMKQNGITADQVAEVFHVANGSVDVIASHVPGKSKREQTLNVYVLMSWLSAVDVLHRNVLQNHRAAFDTEMKRVDSSWKPIKSSDDLGRVKDADFLDRIAGISIIGKNVKIELKQCLDRRNACGHPNSLKIGANTVAHHLEILLLNVFQKFG